MKSKRNFGARQPDIIGDKEMKPPSRGRHPYTDENEASTSRFGQNHVFGENEQGNAKKGVNRTLKPENYSKMIHGSALGEHTRILLSSQ